MNTQGITGHRFQIKRLTAMRESGAIPDTMLFTGPSGIGKKTVAKRFLNSIFCENRPSPCLKCAACRQVAAGSHPDLIELLPDEKGKIPIGSQDMDEPGTVRWLISRLSKRSISGACGVIVDGVETISAAGQNALLKTIEEPREGTKIILISSNRSQVLPTILSRSAEIAFRPLSPGEVAEVIAIHRPGTSPRLIAEISGGSAGRALRLGDDALIESILELASGISGSLRTGNPFDTDLSQFQKNPGYGELLDILMDLYGMILRKNLEGTPLPEELSGALIPESEKIVKLIKIFLALKQGLNNNLNIRMLLKGLLYRIDEIGNIGIPDATA